MTALLAFGFVNPGLLWGLGLVAAPIIIHLLSRRQYRRLPFAAMQFLLEAERRTRRRVRFEQWLLIALRCLALGLLALLMARPFVQPGLIAALLGERENVHRVLVIDDSASLGFRAGETEELQALLAAAERLITWLAQASPADPVTVYLTSAPADPLLRVDAARAALSPPINQRFADVRTTAAPANPQQVLRQILAAEHERTASATDVYLFSDFQRTDWLGSPERPGGGLAALPELLQESLSAGAEPGAAVRLILVASGVRPRNNLAVSSLRIDNTQLVAGMPVLARVALTNHGPLPVKHASVRLAIGGLSQPPVPFENLPAGGTIEQVIELTFPEAGVRVLSADRDAADALPLDDRRQLALTVTPAIEVLLVNGETKSATDDGWQPRSEVFLLRHALAPPGPLPSGVRVTVLEPDELAAEPLDNFDVIFLCNVPTPSAGVAQLLEQFVRTGGGLALTLGDNALDTTAYNRIFHESAALLPAPLTEIATVVGQDRGARLRRAQPHPLTASFGEGDVLSRLAHFGRFVRTGTLSENATIITHYDDPAHTPALLERQVGRGHVLLFTSTIDLDWNDWPRAPDGSFVVNVLDWTRYLARPPLHPREVVVGTPLRLRLAPEVYDAEVRFKPPNFPQQPAITTVGTRPPADRGDELLVVDGPPARHVGVYTVALRSREDQLIERPLAVNPDPAESDLATATAEELSAALGDVPHEYVAAADQFLRRAEEARTEIWPALAAGLFGVLLLEQVLAWHFGRVRSSAATGVGWRRYFRRRAA